MAQIETRGVDLGRLNDGQVDATQEKVKPEVTQATEAQADVVKDDKDPLEVLRAEALNLGLSQEEIAIMTKKDLQSYVDAQVTKAIKTREEKLKKQADIEKMKEKGEYEQLLKQERREALEDLKNTYLEARGLPKEFGALVDTSNLVDLTLSEAKEQLVGVVDSIAQKVEEVINARVNERLKALEAGTFRSVQQQTPTLPDNPKEALKRLFTEQR